MLLLADDSSCHCSLALSLLAGMTASGDQSTWSTCLSPPIRPSRLVHMVAASGFPGSAREREAQCRAFWMPLFAVGLLTSHLTQEVAWLTQTQGVRNRFHLLTGAACHRTRVDVERERFTIISTTYHTAENKESNSLLSATSQTDPF